MTSECSDTGAAEAAGDELGPAPCPVCGCYPGEQAECEHGDGVWLLRIPCGCDCHDDAGDAGDDAEWGW